jgi:WD40 repeat protein
VEQTKEKHTIGLIPFVLPDVSPFPPQVKGKMMINTRMWAIIVLVATGVGHSPKCLAQTAIVSEGHDKSVRSVAFSPDGRLLASGGGDYVGLLQKPRPGEAIVWLDVGKSLPRVVLDGHKDGVSCVTFSPDGTVLATASFDCTVNLWDVTKWRKTATIIHRGGAVTSVAFSPDGRLLATGGWGGNTNDSVHEVKLWDTRTHALIATLKGHREGVMSLTFSPDGRRLATGSMDGTAKVWDVARQKVVATLQMPGEQEVHSVAFSPDGSLLATGSDFIVAKKPGKIMLWRCDEWKPTATLDGQGPIVSCVAFSPDGKILASCGEDGSIVLWDVGRLTKSRTLRGHNKTRIHAITFSPDGKRLVSGGSDGTIGIWELQDRTE